ncbi:MAG: VPLPA-CTERM sorting domain-containing protein [Paracoccaceae bacterium]
MKLSMKAAIAAAAIGLGWVGTANAALIDFTSKSVVAGISGNTLTGNGWVLTGSPSNLNLVNGPQPPGPIGPLAGQTDGLGIKDDEVTYPGESITITFTKTMRLSAVYFLDLFFGRAGTEFALLAVDGSAAGSFAATQYNPGRGNTNSGYGAYTGLNFVGKAFTFSVAPTNDLLNRIDKPDYALAGIDVAPVPLPAGALLLGSALAGFAMLRRRKSA